MISKLDKIKKRKKVGLLNSVDLVRVTLEISQLNLLVNATKIKFTPIRKSKDLLLKFPYLKFKS